MRKDKAVGFFGLLFLDLKNSYHSVVMGITVKIPRVQLCENLCFDAVFRCVCKQQQRSSTSARSYSVPHSMKPKLQSCEFLQECHCFLVAKAAAGVPVTALWCFWSLTSQEQCSALWVFDNFCQRRVKYSAKNGFQTNTHVLCYKLRKQHHSLNWFKWGIKDDYNTQF